MKLDECSICGKRLRPDQIRGHQIDRNSNKVEAVCSKCFDELVMKKGC